MDPYSRLSNFTSVNIFFICFISKCSHSLICMVQVLLYFPLDFARCMLHVECPLLHVLLLFSANNVCFHMSSFNENTGLGYIRNVPVEWVEYPLISLAWFYFI